MKTIHVKYFAVLRDAAAKSEETFQTSAQSAADLYNDLRGRYPAFLPQGSVRVAINNQFRSMDQSICDNDMIVFIPPVAGG